MTLAPQAAGKPLKEGNFLTEYGWGVPLRQNREPIAPHLKSSTPLHLKLP